jgi:hypothetical protein
MQCSEERYKAHIEREATALSMCPICCHPVDDTPPTHVSKDEVEYDSTYTVEVIAEDEFTLTVRVDCQECDHEETVVIQKKYIPCIDE